MTIKTTFAALILALSPGLAFAMGCSGSHATQEAENLCPVGQSWDAELASCAPVGTA